MNKLFLIPIAFLSKAAVACAYVGEPPSVLDLLDEFESHYQNSETILRVRVVSSTDRSNDFQIVEVYKSEMSEGATFTYYDGTDCDMTFKNVGSEYVIFASIIGERLYVFDANAMTSEDPSYAKLREMLEK